MRLDGETGRPAVPKEEVLIEHAHTHIGSSEADLKGACALQASMSQGHASFPQRGGGGGGVGGGVGGGGGGGGGGGVLVLEDPAIVKKKGQLVSRRHAMLEMHPRHFPDTS